MAYSSTPYSPEQHEGALIALWRDALNDPRIGNHVEERMKWL